MTLASCLLSLGEAILPGMLDMDGEMDRFELDFKRIIFNWVARQPRGSWRRFASESDWNELINELNELGQPYSFTFRLDPIYNDTESRAFYSERGMRDPSLRWGSHYERKTDTIEVRLFPFFPVANAKEYEVNHACNVLLAAIHHEMVHRQQAYRQPPAIRQIERHRNPGGFFYEPLGAFKRAVRAGWREKYPKDPVTGKRIDPLTGQEARSPTFSRSLDPSRDEYKTGFSWYMGIPEEIRAHAAEQARLIARWLNYPNRHSTLNSMNIPHAPDDNTNSQCREAYELLDLIKLRANHHLGHYTNPPARHAETKALRRFIKYLKAYLTKHEGIPEDKVMLVINHLYRQR